MYPNTTGKLTGELSTSEHRVWSGIWGLFVLIVPTPFFILSQFSAVHEKKYTADQFHSWKFSKWVNSHRRGYVEVNEFHAGAAWKIPIHSQSWAWGDRNVQHFIQNFTRPEKSLYLNAKRSENIPTKAPCTKVATFCGANQVPFSQNISCIT